MNKRELDGIYNFMVETIKAKEVKRTGWLLMGIKDPERDGDHMFSVAVLSYLMARKLHLNADKCMKMALIHDIHEVITGDIATPHDESKWKVSRKRKEVLELKDSMKMVSYLSAIDRKEFKSLLLEFIACKTREAKFVHEVDALDYVIQLVNYSRKVKRDGPIKEFLLTGGSRIHTPELLYIYRKVKRHVYKERHWK